MSTKKIFRPDLYFKGFTMGIADVIPGVSGGTIAFVSGIYDELLAAISSVNVELFRKIFSGKFKDAFEQINWRFLLSLLSGIFTSILIMSRLLHYLMDHYPVYTWSFFFGLVGASCYFVGREVENLKSWKNITALSLGTLIGYAIVSLIPVQTPEHLWFIFISGAIAICAMILPGISGSFLLLILGKYSYVMGAVKNPFGEGQFVILSIFAMGCGLGLIGFSKFLNFMLHHYRSVTMALLTGFMIGSIKKIWPWKAVIETQMIQGKTVILREENILPAQFGSEVLFSIGLAVLGLLVVVILEQISLNKSNQVE